MKNYNVEHPGIIVEKPVEMANWYRETLGFKIKYSAEDDEKAVAFLTDFDEKVIIELGRIPNAEPLSKITSHNLQFHIALKCNDPEAEMISLIGKGAKFIEKCPYSLPGDNLVVLSDPWGNSIQLAKEFIN